LPDKKKDWIQNTAAERISIQFSIADGLDQKSGILFAYLGAVLIATIQLGNGHYGVWSLLGVSVGLLGIGLAIASLWPVTYDDPPDPEKLADALLGDRPFTFEETQTELIDEQLAAITKNDAVLATKATSIKGAIVCATIATVSVMLQEFAR